MTMSLKAGDEIRIIAPSRSMSILKEEVINTAVKKLEELGLVVTFGKYVFDMDEDYSCASIKSRIEDLHDAFLDNNVKGILTVIGGYNVNQLLDYIDYNIIKENPKIICGFSDITALTNAIYKMTNVVTFSGPNFTNFGMKKGLEYTLEYFRKIMFQDKVLDIVSSDKWSNDRWSKDQENRNFIENNGMYIVNDGQAEGTIIGGNLCTLNLLQGTKYMPSLKDVILFIEDDDLSGDVFLMEFDRNLQSLIHCNDFKYVKGIIIGRCQPSSDMNVDKWVKLIKSKKELENIPVIVNADFGHTTPVFTFPIGGMVFLSTKDGKIKLSIRK